MKSILFPTDFSQTATNAFVYALEMAKGYGASVAVLHNYDPPVISSLHGGDPQLVSDIYQKFLKSEEEKFRNYMDILTQISHQRKATHIELKPLFLQGELTQLIDNVSQSHDIGMVVMGTSGASSLNKKLWGSNTLNVINHTKLPVLGVPAAATILPPNATHITYGVTTLFKESDMVLIEDLLKLGEKTEKQVRIKLLHILPSDGHGDAEVRNKISQWQRYFSHQSLEFVLKKSDNKTTAIQAFVLEEQIDILTMAKRNLDFFQKIFQSSLSEQLVSSFGVPLLVVKENHSKLD